MFRGIEVFPGKQTCCAVQMRPVQEESEECDLNVATCC